VAVGRTDRVQVGVGVAEEQVAFRVRQQVLFRQRPGGELDLLDLAERPEVFRQGPVLVLCRPVPAGLDARDGRLDADLRKGLLGEVISPGQQVRLLDLGVGQVPEPGTVAALADDVVTPL
jgi:hypothetical protein